MVFTGELAPEAFVNAVATKPIVGPTAVAAVVLMSVRSVPVVVSLMRTDFSFSEPVKSPCVAVPIANEAAARREIPESAFQLMGCPVAKATVPVAEIAAALSVPVKVGLAVITTVPPVPLCPVMAVAPAIWMLVAKVPTGAMTEVPA